jgi:hypothetical protein
MGLSGDCSVVWHLWWRVSCLVFNSRAVLFEGLSPQDVADVVGYV